MNRFLGVSVVGVTVAMALMTPCGSRAQSSTKEIRNFYNVVAPDTADPWVFRHSDGRYYRVYSTGSRVELMRSATLSGLGAGERKVVWTPERTGPASREIWAPELHHSRGRWYLYVAADDGENAHHRMFVLENDAKNPFDGQFRFRGQLSAPGEDRWAIDGTMLEIGERLYFLWSGWEGFEDVCQNLYIAPMKNPWTISGPRVAISEPDLEWEKRGGSPLVNEGPEVIVRGGRVLVIYSASGSWSDDYCLGLLTAPADADLLNPATWSKHPRPVFESGNGVIAPGHASFTKSPDGREDWIVYHSARYPGAGWSRLVRTQKFSWTAEGRPDFGSPAPSNRPISLPSGEPRRWRVEAESGQVFGEAKTHRQPDASGGSSVGLPITEGTGLTLEVDVARAGVHGVAIRYRNGREGGRSAYHRLSVNKEPAGVIRYPFTSEDTWSNAFTRISLKKGRNVLAFRPEDGLADLDCVDFWMEEVREPRSQ